MVSPRSLPTYFLRILRKVFSFELSSGAGSATAKGKASVSVDAVEVAAERGGDGFVTEEPEEDEAMAKGGDIICWCSSTWE